MTAGRSAQTGVTAPRLPLITPGGMTPEQSDLYGRLLGDARRGGPKAMLAKEGDGGLAGPFNALLLNPVMGDTLQSLGHELRFDGELTDRVREIVILTVATARNSAFEWDAHVRIGRRLGMSEEELEGIAASAVTFDDPAERLAHRLSLAMVVERQVSDELYEHGVNQFGARGVFEVSVLVGYYDLLALQMRVFGSYP
jgi:4-carboxymuconolactone decarboxylase